MASLLIHNPFSQAMDEDTMETSSDHGRGQDFDIDIDGVNTPATHDDLMDDETQADLDDHMDDDDAAPQEIREEDMQDLVEDDRDEILEDIDYSAETQQHSVHDLDYDLIDDGAAEQPLQIEPPHDPVSTAQSNAEVGAPYGDDSVDTQQYPYDSDRNDNDQEQAVQDNSQPLIQEHVGNKGREIESATEETNPDPGDVGHDVDSTFTAPKGDSTQPVPSELHPCTISWQNVEMSLFQDQDFAQFLIEDITHAYKPLTHLFGECRKVLKESIDDTYELVFDIPQLALRVREDVVTSATCTIADIIDIYVNLSLNDGIDDPEPLQINFFTKTRFEARVDDLREAATSGHGLSHIAELYSSHASEDEKTPRPDAVEGVDADNKLFSTENNKSEAGDDEEHEEYVNQVSEEPIDPLAQQASNEAAEEDDDQGSDAKPIETGNVAASSVLEEAEAYQEATTDILDKEVDASAETVDHGAAPDNQGTDATTNEDNKPASSGSSTALGDAERQDFDPNDEIYEHDYDDQVDTVENSNVDSVENARQNENSEKQNIVDIDTSFPGDEPDIYEIDYPESEGEADTGISDLQVPRSTTDTVLDEPETSLQMEPHTNAMTPTGQPQEHESSIELPLEHDGEDDIPQETYEEEGIDYDDEEIYEIPEINEPDDVPYPQTEVTSIGASGQTQSSNQSPSASLSRKRSFSELEELDEITDEIDLKKARPI